MEKKEIAEQIDKHGGGASGAASVSVYGAIYNLSGNGAKGTSYSGGTGGSALYAYDRILRNF